MKHVGDEWIMHDLFVDDMIMCFEQAPDTPVYEDNAACIKHIDIRKHFAHETIQNRQMRLIKAETSSSLTSSPSRSNCSSL